MSMLCCHRNLGSVERYYWKVFKGFLLISLLFISIFIGFGCSNNASAVQDTGSEDSSGDNNDTSDDDSEDDSKDESDEESDDGEDDDSEDETEKESDNDSDEESATDSEEGSSGDSEGDTNDTAEITDSDTETADTTVAAPEEIELDNFDVLLDPYDAAQLVAVITASHERLTPEDVEEIHIAIKGKGDAEDFTAILDPQSESYQANFDMSDVVDASDVGIPVLGLYPDYENTVEFEIRTPDVRFFAQTTIATKPIENQEGETVIISVADFDRMEPGWTQFDGRIYDHDGICRYVGPKFYRIRSDGNIIGKPDDYNWLGKKLIDRSFPEHLEMHHDNIELPNGNHIVGITDANNEIIEYEGETVQGTQDAAAEVDDSTGEIVNYWDLREFLDVDRAAYLDRDGDWFHLNTLCYDEHDDSVIFSGRHQGVVAVTRGGVQGNEPNRGKELKWILSPHLGWGMSGWNGEGEIDTRDYLLTAVDADGVPYDDDVQNNFAPPSPNPDDFFWPMGQHGLVITHRTDDTLGLLIFNNQASHIYDGPGTIDNGLWFGGETGGDWSNDRAEEPFSQIIEYEINEAEMTVKKLWSFGEHDPELYGSYQSSTGLFPNTGNRMLYTSGVVMLHSDTDERNPTFVEITEEGDVVFYMEIENTRLMAYRANRVNLYHPTPSAN